MLQTAYGLCICGDIQQLTWLAAKPWDATVEDNRYSLIVSGADLALLEARLADYPGVRLLVDQIDLDGESFESGEDRTCRRI